MDNGSVPYRVPRNLVRKDSDRWRGEISRGGVSQRIESKRYGPPQKRKNKETSLKNTKGSLYRSIDSTNWRFRYMNWMTEWKHTLMRWDVFVWRCRSDPIGTWKFSILYTDRDNYCSEMGDKGGMDGKKREFTKLPIRLTWRNLSKTNGWSRPALEREKTRNYINMR